MAQAHIYLDVRRLSDNRCGTQNRGVNEMMAVR